MSDNRKQQRPITTTDAGIPAPSDEYSLTVGPDGPVLLQDPYLVQKMAQFNRERIPERVVHAKGSGAFGYFEVTADVTQWTKAAFLDKVGKRTPMLARFPQGAGEQGYPDTMRDPGGFALKFYTEEGNYDMVGNNTPIFFMRDPQKFQDFIHSQKRLPDTGLRSNNMQWDYWSLSPESAHQVTFLMSDRGTPRAWRNMNGYGSHTYMWINAKGAKVWVKYHFKTEQGIAMFSYADTHRYRVGTNYLQLPVNAPKVEVHSYNKDGPMRYRHNGKQPVYAPNSYGGPQADSLHYTDPGWFTSGEIMRSAYTPHAEDNDFVQPGNLYRQVLSETDQQHLVNNIVTHMSQGVERFIQERTVKNYWRLVDPDLGARVAKGLGLEIAPALTTSGGGE